MNVTFGVMMHIDRSPPAVAVTPLTQPMHTIRSPVDAEIIAEPGPSFRSGNLRHDFMRQPNSSQLWEQLPLTYSPNGKHSYASYNSSGSFLDMFA
jgi:hypothetical protein